MAKCSKSIYFSQRIPNKISSTSKKLLSHCHTCHTDITDRKIGDPEIIRQEC